ncbi:MAG: pyridoxamine kinase [Oscillospiraceae bacterium]|nr:pyridoxamine kinase [Oscillospiraceae bacterium]
MTYPRILTIQDISCVGQCSLTVALPILSACGAETCILPSAVLSTHTGGFQGFTFRDLTDDIPAIRAHWEKEKITFDAIYTGYLGSTRQIDYVAEVFDTMLGKNGRIAVDPAMADNGKLYVGFDQEYVAAMRTLCTRADVILPNITEACLLTDTPYRETYDEAFVRELLSKLTALGAKSVVLTGVSYAPAETGVVVWENRKLNYYCHRRLPKSFHGTGDIYSSAFVGTWMSGRTLYDAARIAANYTVECIENTLSDPAHWYGVKFETALPELIRIIAGA